ncbi:MAG TPA: tripartite tricarboxylate transporter substrate binding protein [Pseudolabrys sp.]|jgi:tripartite-type tricarboxylate transporter receptor subunit TctC|nr:tripartite tricarboxylate transporter substrate binding protein [Pseudolabrys sp.]
MFRRVIVTALLATGLFSQQAALAQYPTKPVHIVVPYPAGGAVDAFARVLTQQLSELWGQQVGVDNRPGASTMIGAEQVAKSPPDGYTLLLTAELTLAIVPHLYEKIPYDPLRDFAPIVALVSATQALVANPSLPVKTVKDLVALAKARPGQLTYGSFGNGSTGHLNIEVLQAMTGARFNHIPYNGAGPAMNDVIGGHIDFMLAALSIVKGNVQAGKLRMIGVGSNHRSSEFPDVPTISESGAPGFEAKSWFGLLAPAGTPPDVIKKINQDVTKVMSDRAFAEKYLAAQGLEPITGTPEQFAALIHAETARWGKVIKDADIKVTK